MKDQMITGKNAWDFAKSCRFSLPFGFNVYYRSTQYSEWHPADYVYGVMRDYYYEQSKNTGKHTLEVALHVKNPNYKHTINASLYEMNEFDFDKLGFEFINKTIDI
jgi:hypothetical protein